MKVNARDKKVLIIGGAVVAASLLYYVADSLIPSTMGLAAQVTSRKRNLARQRELIGQEGMYRARVEQYRKRLEQDSKRFLAGDNPNVAGAALQSMLKDLADQNGVQINRKDIQKEQKIKDDLVKVSVHIFTDCNPDQLVQFLTAIENYDKFLSVDELAVNSYRMQKKYEIKPDFTVSGYIVSPNSKAGEKPATAR